ncbi:stage III sporulation protein AG [Cohnella thailandensis]|uniref:Stage III sporulation protein AG n=1 Tax=Cohnella thailandensis TaxID=557557 RepID=A0A841T0C3_9BACL|nr:stage III sporulation protein AG [Cohnella thailandensis]MBB6635530.1 stage III sporulation protein AG [Cohnella thailandensis]MBP1974910.1 stage III sporulation protein AG [Cohnella thailandensis]
MAKWLQQLETFIGGGPGGPKRIKAFRWLVLIGLVGAALLLAASYLNVKTLDPSRDPGLSPPGDAEEVPQQEAFIGGDQSDKDPFLDIEQTLEGRIKSMLENVVGVGTVDVLITVDSTEEKVVEQNENYQSRITNEEDRNGAKRHITEVDRQGQVVLYEVSGGETPIVVKILKPKIRGVLIVAKGAENATVHRIVAEAVARGLDVPLHRISVVPRKQ